MDSLAKGPFREIVADYRMRSGKYGCSRTTCSGFKMTRLKNASSASSNSSVTVGKSFEQKFCRVQRLRTSQAVYDQPQSRYQTTLAHSP